MKLENTFSVPVPLDEAWRVLLDIERIAPCVPGAALTSHDGDSFGGKVKVKLGPIGLTYSGTATFVSRDEAAKIAVIEAGGRPPGFAVLDRLRLIGRRRASVGLGV